MIISIYLMYKYSWAKNTYHLSDIKDLKSERTEITYYQWLVFILIFLAFCYYTPYLIWKCIIKSNFFFKTRQIPIDVSGIITILKCVKLYKLKEFNSAIEEIVKYLNHYFIQNSIELKKYQLEKCYNKYERKNYVKINEQLYISKRKRVKICCKFIDSFNGSILIVKYFFVKFLYISISISIFWFINLFLNFNEGFTLFGINIIYGLVRNDITYEKLWYSKTFPRIVFCDLEVKADWKNKHNLTFQCSLAANVFNEKVFIFLWFWLFFVAILNCISVLKWIFLLKNRKRILSNYLNLNETRRTTHEYGSKKVMKHRDIIDNTTHFDSFIRNYLQYDGFFVLLLIKENLNDLCFKRLVESLWAEFSTSDSNDKDEGIKEMKIEVDSEINEVQTSTINETKLRLVDDKNIKITNV